MVKVSIIMPSYNVGRYIEKCLLSVMNQTLKEIEIIVVDKFSTDGTREIIRKYENMDNRIKLLDDDIGSCGYSNNKAIAAATGKYIGIVETDDYIDPEMYEVLYDLAEKNYVDYVKTDFYEFIEDADGNEISRINHILGGNTANIYNTCIQVKDYPELLYSIRSMWAALYRKDFLDREEIRFNESKGAAYQDHGFLWQIVTKAGSAMYTDHKFYHYRLDNENCSMCNPYALKMDFGELMFIKQYLLTSQKENGDYWWIFTQKCIGILKSRLLQYFENGGKITESLKETVEFYKKEIIKGINSKYAFFDLLEQKEYEMVCTLLESVDDYLKVLMRGAIFRREQIEIIIKKAVGQIVIFGCGKNGVNFYWLLTRRGMENKVAALCDNDITKSKMKIGDKTVFSPEEAVRRFGDSIFVIANAGCFYDMRRQLLSMGIASNQILCFNMEC